MTIARNLARLLRDEDGSFSGEAMGLALVASVLAAGALTLVISSSVGWALAAATVMLPVQLVALCWRPSAIVAAVIGTLLVAAAACGVTALVVSAGAGTGWLGWLIGGVVGAGFAVWIGRDFRRAIERLDQPGWY